CATRCRPSRARPRSGDCSKPSAAARPFLHEVATDPCALTHSDRDRPGNPAVVGFAPLDRKFCDARLSAGCAVVPPSANRWRLTWCNGYARHAKCAYEPARGPRSAWAWTWQAYGTLFL